LLNSGREDSGFGDERRAAADEGRDFAHEFFLRFSLAARRAARFDGVAFQLTCRRREEVRSRFVWLIGCAVVWAVSVTVALAEDKRVDPAEHAASCAREAKGLKGEEHQRSLSECLGRHEGGAAHSQQEKMKYCNAEARRRDIHGDERRAFMSSCLRG
jgi:hypothetical protein